MSKRVASSIAMAFALVMAVAQVARADVVVYSQTFDTASSDLLNDSNYPGFSYSGWGVVNTYTVSGGKAVIATGGTGGSFGRLVQTLATPYAYDWSQPLTLSADISSTSTLNTKKYGIYMNNLWYGRYNGGSNNDYGQGGTVYNGQIMDNSSLTDVIDSTVGFNISITVRQNAGDFAKFDVRFQVDGVDQYDPTPGTGITYVDGWYTGASKATYSLAGNITSFGLAADVAYNSTYTVDNLQLTVIPEPATLSMLGVIGIAMLLRKKIHG